MPETVTVKPIRTEADYECALKDIESLMDARPGTPEADDLDVLATLVDAYEAEHHAINAPDPIALIEFAMEQRGAERADLEPLIGSRGRISEVLSRKRPLSISMIRNLQDEWHLPAEVLVRTYSLRRMASRKTSKTKSQKRRVA